ncbi:alpha/beta fold hydrolase [Kitasatospora paranensis]|uniref:Alpha/beta fold hydrolase n=1 Tax=Kitasatospora paranensis TaxID=258053 RepID=A0ABW2G0W8_9ACTN
MTTIDPAGTDAGTTTDSGTDCGTDTDTDAGERLGEGFGEGSGRPAAEDPALRLPDGRVLRYRLHGPEDGMPLLMLGGTPDTRLLRPATRARLAAAGIRAVTVDRPGYGGSTRRPGRGVADTVDALRRVADSLGWQRFAVSGFSGGGPYALGCAALLPDRVTRCAVLSGVAPADADGLDFHAGMSAQSVAEFRHAAQGEQVLRPFLQRYGREVEQALAELPGDPERPARLRAMWRDGLDGWVDDHLALARPWGFDPADVTVPVAVLHGTADSSCPPAHARWLLARIRGAEPRPYRGGHEPPEEVEAEALGWLRGPEFRRGR